MASTPAEDETAGTAAPEGTAASDRPGQHFPTDGGDHPPVASGEPPGAVGGRIVKISRPAGREH